MQSKYSFFEKITNAISLLYTKIFWPNARLVRLPVRIRGKRSIQYGNGFTTGYSCRIDAGKIDNNEEKTITIGKNFIVGDFAHIAGHEKIVIGNNVLIASRVYISDTTHGNYSDNENASSPDSIPNNRKLYFKEVIIGDNVWIGENVCILPGVHIGNGCIIGANSVVTHDVDSNTIVAGAPAEIIKYYDSFQGKWRRS